MPHNCLGVECAVEAGYEVEIASWILQWDGASDGEAEAPEHLCLLDVLGHSRGSRDREDGLDKVELCNKNSAK